MSTTTDDISSKNSSPRISFSHDLSLSNLPSSPQKFHNSPNSDFDFNVSLEIITAQHPGPADELFSDGKILPLPLKNPNPKPTEKSVNGAAGGQKSFWQFGRSSSLNCVGSRMKIKFPRSKSDGSDPNPKQQRGRISPVPLYPKEGNGTGVIGFLLCSCRDKRMDYSCSP